MNLGLISIQLIYILMILTRTLRCLRPKALFNPASLINVQGIHSSRTLWAEKFTQKLPTLGDSISSGVVSEWLVQEGEYVKADDPIAIVDSDKVSRPRAHCYVIYRISRLV